MQYGGLKTIDAISTKNQCVAWIKDWVNKNGNENSKVVIGISGGKDSTIATALCVEALGKERVIGVMMPLAIQTDIGDSQRVIDLLGIIGKTINIAEPYTALTTRLNEEFSEKINSNYRTNTPARLRTVTLYSIASIIGNCFVCHTGNLSEKFIGWTTYGGDNLGDFSPLGLLTKTEVVQIGDALNLPSDLVHKQPADGMCGYTDEDKLGFTYEELDRFIRNLEETEHADMIRELYVKNSFKRENIQLPTFKPEFMEVK